MSNKYCQSPHESSFSSSQRSNHNYYNINFHNNTPIINHNQTSTRRSSQSPSPSSCHPYNSFGSKLGLSLIHLQSLFTKRKTSNTAILAGLKTRFMATPAGEFSPSEIIRKKKLNGQQKREELEREVSLLQNMLNNEEKVNQVLKHVQNQNKGSVIAIPNFLPPKTKELLAELAMVEGEIARLEDQITQLKLGLKREQDESKAKQWRYGSPIRSVCTPSSFTFPSPLNNNSVQSDKMGYETKMHFIGRAIKAEYNNSSENERRGSLKTFGDQKENVFQGDRVHEKTPRNNGSLKSGSPMRDTRYSSPRPMRNPGTALEIPTKPVSMTLSEENIQNWQPNKLSEEIIKCLNFIYVRLLRTTRAMELEKSGPVARASQHPSLSSRSFRVDSGSKSRQQDPYGIFNEEECIPRDVGPYKNLVIFTATSMDPKCISSPSSIPLLTKLRMLMGNLQTVELRSLTYQQKLAFWINMYNACIMHGFLQFGVPSTPEKLLTLMNKAILNIGGNIINAQAIEHYILRKSAPSSLKEAMNGEKEDKEAMVRELYGLEATEPNVTFALCCGTRSSPAVRMYTGESVVAELERSKLEYLQASVMVKSTKKIALPELILRNTLDFAADKELLIEWVCHQLPTSGSLRKSLLDCLKTSHSNSGRVTSSAIVDKIPYDYEFQYLLAI